MSLPLFDPLGEPETRPSEEAGPWKPFPPHRGTTTQSAENSRSGAVVAAPTFARKTQRILAVLERGPLSRQGIAEATGIPINAVCSCVASLVSGGAIEVAGTEHAAFRSGTTTRETFQIRRR